MCGRYYFDLDTEKEILSIVREIDSEIHGIKYGDVYPSENAMVIAGNPSGLSARKMKWGFPAYQSKKGKKNE